MPTYSFNGVPFGPRSEEKQPKVSAPTPYSGLRHVPYSNFDVLDKGGKGSRTYAAEIKLLPENVAAFEDMLLEDGPLVVWGATWPTATLIELEGHGATPRGEYEWYNAKWVVG
jgi:hypothetical protein